MIAPNRAAQRTVPEIILYIARSGGLGFQTDGRNSVICGEQSFYTFYTIG